MRFTEMALHKSFEFTAFLIVPRHHWSLSHSCWFELPSLCVQAPNLIGFLLQGRAASESHSVLSDSLWPHGPYSPWNSPGQTIGMGSLFLLQGIFPTWGTNPGLPHCRQILSQPSYKGSPLLYQLSHRRSNNSAWSPTDLTVSSTWSQILGLFRPKFLGWENSALNSIPRHCIGNCCSSSFIWNPSPDPTLGTSGGSFSSPFVRSQSTGLILRKLLVQSFSQPLVFLVNCWFLLICAWGKGHCLWKSRKPKSHKNWWAWV